MDKSLVSIIIPAYNVESYIGNCISSIISQTYNNIEIIVVNDGSTDNTKGIIEELCLKDKRIKLVNRFNSGVSASRNYGIDIANGEWIVFVDGDDYLSEDYIEYMLTALRSTGAEYCINTDCYKSVKDIQSNPLILKEISAEEATALLLSPRIEVGCWNKMYSKKLLDRNSIRFNTSLFYGEGLHFITMVAQLANKSCLINKKIYYYRQNNGYSATKHFNIEKIHNGWNALNVIEKDLLYKSDLVNKRLAQHQCLFSLSSITKILNSGSQVIYKTDYKKHLQYVRRNLFICLKDNEIAVLIKIKLVLCSLCPHLLSFLSLISQKKRTIESV